MNYFKVYTECPYCRAQFKKRRLISIIVDGKQTIIDESLAKFRGILKKEKKMKKKMTSKKMEILELEKRILAFGDEVKSIFKKVEELAGENEIITERSRAYWYGNIMSWIDGKYQYYNIMEAIEELKKENE